MKTAILHFSIAIVWLFLSPTRDLPRFFIGLLLGYPLILLFRPLLPTDAYLKANWGFLRWLASFLKALILSQIRVGTIILFPRQNPINPGVFDFSIGDLSDLEVLILSHTITLTPGTASVDIDREGNRLLIHALEAGDPDRTRAEIEENLLKPLLAFTRP